MEEFALADAGFRYGAAEKWIFRHLTLTLNRGDGIRIRGRNGSGKSTLLKICSGLLPLTEGCLRRAINTRVVYMDQFSSQMLAPGMTIAEHFSAFAAGAKGLIEPVKVIREFGLNLEQRGGEFVGHLSGGERQIVALLCTLASGANVLCLDEFTAALDDRSAQLADGLVEYSRTTAQLTVLLVSHQSREWRGIRDVTFGELTAE